MSLGIYHDRVQSPLVARALSPELFDEFYFSSSVDSVQSLIPVPLLRTRSFVEAKRGLPYL